MGLPFLSSWDQQSGVCTWECSLRDPFDSGPLRVTGVLLPMPNGQAVTLPLRLEPRPVRSLAQKMRPQAPEHGPRGHTRGGHRHASTRIDVHTPLCTAHRHPRADKRCAWPTRVQTGPDRGVHGHTRRLTCMHAHTHAYSYAYSPRPHVPLLPPASASARAVNIPQPSLWGGPRRDAEVSMPAWGLLEAPTTPGSGSPPLRTPSTWPDGSTCCVTPGTFPASLSLPTRCLPTRSRCPWPHPHLWECVLVPQQVLNKCWMEEGCLVRVGVGWSARRGWGWGGAREEPVSSRVTR